jgi:ribosomal protection tetracycline resistance protein
LLRTTLNLGILAHVDAGKTTLTERLLYAAGVIDAVGSVDGGTTQTDSLALEQRRGITIKAAVASFAVDDVDVNLIDTPGHPDFVAEVERVLSVLDGAVLVLSAVEGVQAQTHVLMRALQRLQVPTLLFVNKIDRAGAECERVLAAIAAKLTPAVVPMGTVREPGTRGAAFSAHGAGDAAFGARLADVLAARDDALLAAYVDDENAVSYRRLRDALAAQTRRGVVHPVFFGSASTGAGVDDLVAGVAELLPPARGDAGGPVSGTVFKVDRGAAGERIAYVRLFSGTVRPRDRVRIAGGEERRITAIGVFERRPNGPRAALSAGEIGRLWGLGDVRIGDALGIERGDGGRQFAPPALETVVVPRRPADRGRLRVALAQLAEQDPLIDLRQDDVRQELVVSLYGEVQKEVVRETLASDFGVDVHFRATTAICVERPAGTGGDHEVIATAPNPFLATVGLRVEPADFGAGVELRLEVELGSLPLAFSKAIEETVHATLRQGVYGWQVTDCIVTLTHSGYWSTTSTAGDFRNLTPLVLMSALKQAGTIVYEPIDRFHLDLPTETLGPLLPVLARLRAAPEPPATTGPSCTLEGSIPAAHVHELRQQLPALTRGEGVLECAFDRYRPVGDAIPTRPRSDNNPLNRKEYLLHVLRRV